MGKKITMHLSVKDIRRVQNELRQYQQELNRKCEVFCRRLAECGIEVAKQNVGGYGKYIAFSIKVSSDKNGCKALMVATNTGHIHSEWMTEDGVKSADVSPLMMAEFGSGLKANNPNAERFGMGTGTFPGQTHATAPNGWYWMDLDGNWHHSFGITPTMPMYHASTEMILNIRKIAREVFSK